MFSVFGVIFWFVGLLLFQRSMYQSKPTPYLWYMSLACYVLGAGFGVVAVILSVISK